MRAQDKEIQQYRDLMEVPDKFEGGFGFKTIVGALFLGFLMVPGSIYLSLFMGATLGPAAQWVTVILFAEVAKRSMKDLRKQEIFVLFYMTGIALNMPLQGLLWNQYLLWQQYYVQSPAAQAFGIDVPNWIAPSSEVIASTGRTFFMRQWMPAIAFLAGAMVIQRLDQFSLGYALYRITAHIEKLPFPMAPVGGFGVTALAESHDQAERWRWRCFSLGGVMGLGFGLIYTGIPAVTGALFGHPIKIIPIPWLDLTSEISTHEFLPAVPINLVFDLTFVLVGMVLPFWAVVGGFVGLVIMFILNPLLYQAGMLTTWTPGMKVVSTLFSNTVDFHLSFGIGLLFAIFLISLGTAIRPLLRRFITGRREKSPYGNSGEPPPRRSIWHSLVERSKERGQISILLALLIYVVSTIGYILACLWLMPGTPEMGYRDRFPWLFFLGFGFLYQPILSYTAAKLEGLVGQTMQMPLVREAAFILSGYRGSAIWFAPIPRTNYAAAVRSFRVMELTGTKLSSIIKTEILALPILIVTVVIFSELIWRLAPVPSEVYPFAQELWHLRALGFSLQATATQAGSSPFLEALKPEILGWGLGGGLVVFTALSFLNLPTFLFYGMVRGLGQMTPGGIPMEFIGALIGRFYLQRKLGHRNYKRYMSIILAGFMAGVGLIGMAAVAIALILKSTTTLGY